MNSTGGLRVGKRLLARLRKEQPLWGLSGAALVRAEGGGYRIEAETTLDAVAVEGFLAAALAMPAMDLRRRLWSGRLAELLGDRRWATGLTVSDLDIFVRLLRLRDRSERHFRQVPDSDRGLLEAYTRGVNSWIDSGLWEEDPFWADLRSRPRLWAASDSLLLVGAETAIGIGEPAIGFGPDALEAGWPPGWTARLQSLWGCVRDPRLRGPGGVAWRSPLCLRTPDGAELAHWCGEPAGLADPSFSEGPYRLDLVPETVLEGEDNHRVAETNRAFRRLKVRRPDIAIRGGKHRRPWLRWSLRGGLVSDLLQGAEGAQAPAGPAFALRIEEASAEKPPREAPPPVVEALPPDHAFHLLPDPDEIPPLPTFRLRPMEAGA